MSLRRILISILTALLFAAPAAAKTVSATFGWTESDPKAVACRLYVADADGNFTQVGEDVLLPDTTMVVDFTVKGVYVFVATAVSATGIESEFSLPCTVKAAKNTITQL